MAKISSPIPIYSEAMMPSAVYGWSPLHSVTLGRWRLIDAPRPELYDLASDPGEGRNLIVDQAEEAKRLQRVLDELVARPPVDHALSADLDSETRAALQSLGSWRALMAQANDGIDPKDGIALLATFDEARGLLTAGQSDRALALLQNLVMQNPSNVPFLNRLAQAQLAEGRGDEAIVTLGQTLELAPGSVFVNQALADTLRQMKRDDQARVAYRTTLGIDPRWAPAWLGMAKLAGSTEERRSVLTEAEAAGVGSLHVLLQLARLEADAGNPERSVELLDCAESLEPDRRRRAPRACAAVGGSRTERRSPRFMCDGSRSRARQPADGVVHGACLSRPWRTVACSAPPSARSSAGQGHRR